MLPALSDAIENPFEVKVAGSVTSVDQIIFPWGLYLMIFFSPAETIFPSDVIIIPFLTLDAGPLDCITLDHLSTSWAFEIPGIMKMIKVKNENEIFFVVKFLLISNFFDFLRCIDPST
jgi:hypothetical protein